MAEQLFDILQIIYADIVLSGDNALVIGMAAAGLSSHQRRRAIFLGMMLAAILRIIFAITASYLLAIPGILIIGGLLLCWVCWRFFKDLQHFNAEVALDSSQAVTDNDEKQNITEAKSFSRAFVTILMADISMSIDNILAVAAIARDNTTMLVFGLALAILFMAFFAGAIMKIMLRFRWLAWLGLLLLIYLSLSMLYDGLRDIGWLTLI